MVELITGTAGKDHVSAADVGSFNAGIIGEGTYILPRGKRMQCEKVSDNLVKVLDGDMIFKGRHIRIEPDDYEELTIVNGASGTKRHDLICVHVEKNENTQIETASFVVVQGEFADNPTDPQYTKGTILEGDYTVDEYPICRVVLNGLQIESVTMLVEEVKAISELQEEVARKANEEDVNTSVKALEKSINNLNSSKADTSSVNNAFSSVNSAISDLETSKAKQTELKALSDRVDNLTSLGEDATEGNLELLDIRVGADGTVHKSAGEAVRTQIKNVEGQIDAHTVTTTDTTLSNSKASALKVNAIRGKSEQKSYSGKNLYDGITNNKGYSYDGITLTKNTDGTLAISGTATATTNMIMNSFTLPAGTYYLTSGETKNTIVALYDQTNAKFVAYNSGTFTLSAETNLDIRVQVTSGATASGTIKIQIEKGSIATEYEPYVGGIASPNPQYEQKIRSVGDSGSLMVAAHGKNCLRNDVVSTTKNGIIFTVNNDKSITVKGTATADIYFQDYSATTMRFKPVIGKKYKLYGYREQSNAVQGYFVKVNGSSSWVCNPLGTVATITSSDDILYNIYIAKGTTVDTTIYPLVIECDADGNPISGEEYEPYTESTFEIPLSEPLRKLDEIIKKDGLWGVYRRIKKRVFDGSEAWSLSGGGWIQGNVLSESSNMTSTGTVFNGYCSHLQKISRDSNYKGLGGYGTIAIYSVTAFIHYDKLTTLEEYKAWLAENPITVEYELATPTFEPFADEYQELFYQLESYEGVTYITTDSEVQPIIEVEYAVTDAGAHMLNNYAKSNLAELKAGNALSKSNITQSTAVTETGLYAVDAVELNPSVEGTLANRVIQCSKAPEFTYIENATVVRGSTLYEVSNCKVYIEKFTYDSHIRKNFYIKMNIDSITAENLTELFFYINEIGYKMGESTLLNVAALNSGGYIEPAVGVLNTRNGNGFDIKFENAQTESIILMIEFVQYENI